MKFCIVLGSCRAQSNTNALCQGFIDQLKELGQEVEYVTLFDKQISPCKGCYACQQEEGYSCQISDDMHRIAPKIIEADVLVLATPIYHWYCTAEMKAMLDRLYPLNKYYGEAKNSLWNNKKLALILTHGYDKDYACSPFITGIQRLAKHSHIEYVGEYTVQDEDDINSFTAESAQQGAKVFAKMLVNMCNNG